MVSFKKLSSYMKRTDDISEMVSIAKRIAADYQEDIYTPLMIRKMYEGVENYLPRSSPEEKEEMVFRAIYDFWAHGCFVDEEFFLKFDKKTNAEKSEYLVGKMRNIYIDHLNDGGGAEMRDQLEDKFKLYQLLQPYYRREMIQISDETDYAAFEGFVKRHKEFVVKPIDFFCGYGVHKDSVHNYGDDSFAAFNAILQEGLRIKEVHPSRNPKMVLEELIIQDPSMAELHPNSVNAIRVTTIKGKDGKIHVFHPWIKVGMNGTFIASAALDGFDAEIDPQTGVVISDGYQENGNTFAVHPNSGITIKGFQIPRWDELLVMVDEIMQKLPKYGYIGWDFVLTPDGWCIMEGNYPGDFIFQLINGRGFRKEIEDLIGWKYDYEYWWQSPDAKF